jgi:hypothetical protein
MPTSSDEILPPPQQLGFSPVSPNHLRNALLHLLKTEYDGHVLRIQRRADGNLGAALRHTMDRPTGLASFWTSADPSVLIPDPITFVEMCQEVLLPHWCMYAGVFPDLENFYIYANVPGKCPRAIVK